MEDILNPLIGFRDVFGEEKRITEYIKIKLTEIFQLWGYDLLEIPIVEKFTSYSEEIIGHSPWPEWDVKGCFYIDVNDYNSYDESAVVREALLIPEGTVSVARWISREILDKGECALPKKICYSTVCFRNELIYKLTSTKYRQFDQIGLEILGSHSKSADTECILLISTGLNKIGFNPNNIVIRMSDVEIFNKLCELCNLNPESRLIVKEFLDAIAENRALNNETEIFKLKHEFEQYIDSLNINTEKRNFWMLFTEKDGFETLPETITQPVLMHLKELADDLTKKFNLNVQIDASVVRSHEYYTGIVFEVDYLTDDKIYVEIVGGGRYNKLIGKFTNGKISVIPSTGFAYGIQRLVNIWKDVNNNKKTDSINFYLDKNSEDLIVLSKSNNYHNAFTEAEKHRKQGKRVNIYFEKISNEEIIKTTNVTEVE